MDDMALAAGGCNGTATNGEEADNEAMVADAALRFGVRGKTCLSTDLAIHAGAECAKHGQKMNQECVNRGVLDYDCRQTPNPNPNDTPEACVERRLAGGPKWLVPGAPTEAANTAAGPAQDKAEQPAASAAPKPAETDHQDADDPEDEETTDPPPPAP